MRHSVKIANEVLNNPTIDDVHAGHVRQSYSLRKSGSIREKESGLITAPQF